jgi:hypothetical protein
MKSAATAGEASATGKPRAVEPSGVSVNELEGKVPHATVSEQLSFIGPQSLQSEAGGWATKAAATASEESATEKPRAVEPAGFSVDEPEDKVPHAEQPSIGHQSQSFQSHASQSQGINVQKQPRRHVLLPVPMLSDAAAKRKPPKTTLISMRGAHSMALPSGATFKPLPLPTSSSDVTGAASLASFRGNFNRISAPVVSTDEESQALSLIMPGEHLYICDSIHIH